MKDIEQEVRALTFVLYRILVPSSSFICGYVTNLKQSYLYVLAILIR